MPDSDVFIISFVCNAEPSEAIRLAVEGAGIKPSSVQDAVFGWDGSSSAPSVHEITRKAGLVCGAAAVSSSLRAIFFASQSILSGDVELVVVAGLENNAGCAFLLAAPEAVGRWNLVPRARLAARSLIGSDSALRSAGLTDGDVTVSKRGENGAPLVIELLEELEARQAQWGLAAVGDSALLLERV